MSNSLPYVLLLGTVAIGLSVFLYVVLDPTVSAIVATDAWNSGSQETMAGRERLEAMWSAGLVVVISGVSLSVLWASRRGR